MNQSASRPGKRRLESEEDYDHGGRDESMDRSPTPERPKRAVPKRARLVPAQSAAGKENAPSSEGKAIGGGSDEVDVGVLLGVYCFFDHQARPCTIGNRYLPIVPFL
jgi:hypothetical protein